MKLSCYIIDDEPLAVEVLESHLETIGQIEIAGTFSNAVQAYQALHERPVDLLFLDIRMPRLTGINFLKTLRDPPHVIFTTAYREYALEGFELDVVDYLLKPVSFERFLKAINKVWALRDSSGAPERAVQADAPAEFLYVYADKKTVRIPVGEILFIESLRDYVKIKTLRKEILAHQTMSSLEKNLPSDRFLRIHRSFIVALDKIESWSASEIEIPGMHLPIGRTYKSEVMKILQARIRSHLS